MAGTALAVAAPAAPTLVEVGLVVDDRGWWRCRPLSPVPAQPEAPSAAEAAAASAGVVDQLDHHDRHVVAVAVLAGQPHQLVRGVGRVGQAAQHRGDGRLGHLVEQAVGAQHVAASPLWGTTVTWSTGTSS